MDMNTKLSRKQVGQRITLLRKAKGLSQEELAKNFGISRPSLAQIELGNRGVDILEMQNLSLVLGFSLDEFMSEDFTIQRGVETKEEKKSKKKEERISVPTLQVYKFKNVLLYILERCAGNGGEVAEPARDPLDFEQRHGRDPPSATVGRRVRGL